MYNSDTDIQKSIDLSDFEYKNGNLYRISSGKKAGWFDRGCGYERIKIKNKSYLVHRVVFLLHYGYLPEYVDHIDQDKLNNKVENLRECPYKGSNTINSKARSDNTSGFKGVTWHKTSKKWHSSVYYKGKRHYLGVYEDINEAALVYNNKAIELFGPFAELNLIKEV